MPSGLKTRKFATGRQAQHPGSRFRHGFLATRRFSSGNKLRGEKYDGRMADVWSCGVILYALLVGALPFDDDNLRNLLEKVKKGVFHIPPFVSPDCQSLLRAMIEVNPRKRITLKEVLEHRWVTSDTSMPLQLELPMTQAVQTAVIPTRADIDPDIFGTMTSLQCFRDQEKLVEELLSPVHNTEKVIYFLLLDRKLRNPSADDPEEIRSRSSTLNLNSSKADPPRKRIDSLKLTLNGSSRLSLGNLSEGSPLSGRRGLAVQKLRKKSFSSGLDSQSSTPAVSPLGSPLSLQRVHCRTVSCESTGTILSSPNSLAIPSPHRAQAPTISRHPPNTIPTPVAAVCSDNGVQNTAVSVHTAGKTLHSVPSEAVGIPVVSTAVGHPQHGLNFYCFGSIPPLGPGAQHLMHPPMGPLPVPTTMATPFVPALHLLPHLHPNPFTGGPYLIPTMPPFPTPLPPMPAQSLTQQQQQNPSSACIPPPGNTLKSPTHSKPTQSMIEQTSPLATTPVNAESDGHSSVASTINCAESASPTSTEELITVDGQTRLDASTPRPIDSPGPSDRQPNEGRTKTYSPVSQVSGDGGCSALRMVSPNTAPSSPVDLISSRPKRSSIPSSPPAYVNRHNRDAYPVQPINLSHSKQAHLASSTTNDKTRANGSALCSPTPSVRSIKSPLLYSSSSSTSPSADKRKTIHCESPRTNVDSRSTASPSLSSPNSRTRHVVTSTPSSTPSATTPTSPNASNQPWRAKLTNLKMSFLGSPRFHRKKSGLVEETPPSSPKVSGFVHNRQTNPGRSVPSEPSPLLTHKSWFDGFLSAASGHVIFKGSQHAFNAAAAAEDAAALAISTNAKSKEINSDGSSLSKVNNSPDLSTTPPLDNLTEETCFTADSPTSSVATNDEVNATSNNSQSSRIRTNRQVTIHEPPVSTELKVGTSKTPDTAGLSNKSSNERRSGKAATTTSNASTVPEETNHVVMIKGRALNRLKAELVQVFLATPGVVHTVISPTSFRAEYRRTGSGSTLLARPVKLQVDMVRATGGISTGSTSGKSLCSVPSEREVYAVNFQLLSGPTRRFKRLCDQLQTALLAGPSQPNFSAASAVSNGCGSNKSLMSDHSHTHPPASGRCVSLAEREDGLVNSHPRSEIIRNIQAKSPESSGCWKSDEPDSSNSETANHSQPPSSPKQFTLQTSPVISMVGRLENNGIGNKAFDNSGECKG